VRDRRLEVMCQRGSRQRWALLAVAASAISFGAACGSSSPSSSITDQGSGGQGGGAEGGGGGSGASVGGGGSAGSTGGGTSGGGTGGAAGAGASSGGSGGSGDSGGSAGGTSGAGGSGAGTGAAGASGGHAGQAGHGAGGAAGAGGSKSSGGAGAGGAFICNLVIGNSTTQQWFDGGFLSYPGIDPTHWELIWVAHHYIDSWASPSDAGWTTPLDMGHACAAGSTTPDRVIFIVTYAPPYPPESTYETDTTSIVTDIQTKYPTVRRIEIMTLIRSPENVETACSSAANNEQSIPAAEDQGIAAVAADPAFAGLVVALPPSYVPSCADFVTDGPQYTTAGAIDIANVYGAYYAAHP
jgi:hypothetical protein